MKIKMAYLAELLPVEVTKFTHGALFLSTRIDHIYEDPLLATCHFMLHYGDLITDASSPPESRRSEARRDTFAAQRPRRSFIFEVKPEYFTAVQQLFA